MALNGCVVDYGCELSEPIYMKRCHYYELIYLTSYISADADAYAAQKKSSTLWSEYFTQLFIPHIGKDLFASHHPHRVGRPIDEIHHPFISACQSALVRIQCELPAWA